MSGRALVAAPRALVQAVSAPFRNDPVPMEEVSWPGARLQATGEAGGARRLSQKAGRSRSAMTGSERGRRRGARDGTERTEQGRRGCAAQLRR
eukprot:scaffold2418_cov296-Prasinococcus_capsulatus_cf.AAC.5